MARSPELARLFQQPDLENHWEPMRNRALPSVMAFVAQAAGFRNAEFGMRNVEEIRIELIPNSAFRIFFQRPRTRLESWGTHDHYDDARLWSTVSCECEDG